MYLGNSSQKEAGVAVLTSDKIYFRAKNVTRDRESNFIMINRSVHQEDVIILNVFKIYFY